MTESLASAREPVNHAKAATPKLGEAFGDKWSAGDTTWYRLPGGGVLQFNLDNLTLSDFRAMRDHYQVNASLAVLSFMMHQLDWKIVSDNQRVADFCTENMKEIWTRLVRALGQAFWAGFSPCILQWENDLPGGKVRLTKVKDLTPELADVNWGTVEGWAPPGYIKPKIRVYDGIKQYGVAWPIPKENTLWYTLLKTNDNWYGQKLLRPAFTPWYFSILIHMFANRYFERFGEPLLKGRAPDAQITQADGTKTTGMKRMHSMLQQLRNHSVVTLPDDRSTEGTDTKYDYEIEYLESQMRGADFERYLMRLDEEISLSLFTPLLILRTADVGSYNLGTGHWNVYQQMLNALAGDWAEYIDRYILSPLVDLNFGVRAKRAKIVFRKLGSEKMQTVLTLIQALISGGKVMPNLEELGEIAGLTLDEVKEVTKPDEEADPQAKDKASADSEQDDDAGGKDRGSSKKPSSNSVAEIKEKVYKRVLGQIGKAKRDETGLVVDLGYRKQLEEAAPRFAREISEIYQVVPTWLSEVYSTSGASAADSALIKVLDSQFARLASE